MNDVKATVNRGRRLVLSQSVLMFLVALGKHEPTFAQETAAQNQLEKADKSFQTLLQHAKNKRHPVTLTLPKIAENGHVVKVSVNVDNPMTKDDYVESITLITESNPNRTAIKFGFTPLSGRAYAQTRIRLARSQYVIAAVRLNTGRLMLDARFVEVTVGGCAA